MGWKATYYGPDIGLHPLPTFLFTPRSNPQIKGDVPPKMTQCLTHGKTSENIALLPIVTIILIFTETQRG